MILLLLATCTLIYVIHFYWRVSKYPKGPMPLPIIGNMHQLSIRKISNDVKALADKYGQIYTIWLMNRPIVVLSTHEALREALVTKGELLVDRPHNVENDIFQMFDNGGVVFSNGESWRDHRRSTLHILRDLGAGKNRMNQMIQEQAANVINHIESNIDKDAVDFFSLTVNMVANIINQFLFGYAYPFDKSERLMKVVNSMNEIMLNNANTFWPQASQAFPILRSLPFTGYRAFGQFKESMNKMHAVTDVDIEKCLSGYSCSEDPTCLVQAYYQQLDKSEHFDKNHLRNLISDMFFAGTETTTNTLRWIVLYLTNYPIVQERMRQEISSKIGHERIPNLSDKNSLSYCQATILEVQRHSNMMGFNLQRQTTQELTLCGQTIPKGTTILPQSYNCHLDKQIFKNPDEFMPERFLTADAKSLDQDMVNKMVIFGMGKRVCAGEGLARAELFIFTTVLIQKYHFLPRKDRQVDMKPVLGLIIPPKRQLIQLRNVNPLNYVD